MIEVDEFKFAKIISSVLQRQSCPLKPDKNELDDSCSLSDDYGDEDETELSHRGGAAVAAEHHEVQLKELEWSETQQIFSALDASNFESVGFREFCALVFLLAASHDNKLLECLY